MNKWKNKDNYFLHLDTLHLQGINYVKKYGIYSNSNRKNDIEKLDLIQNADERYLNNIKLKMSDKLFNHLKYYYLIKLSLYDLIVILSAEAEWELFKRTKMSKDGYQFDKQIEGLKANADYMEMLTIGDPKKEIKLPILPHVTISTMYDYFTKKNMDQDTISQILVYFLEVEGAPKPRNDAKLSKLIRKISSGIENELVENGVKYEPQKIMGMVKDSLGDYFFYTPKNDSKFLVPPFKAV